MVCERVEEGVRVQVLHRVVSNCRDEPNTSEGERWAKEKGKPREARGDGELKRSDRFLSFVGSDVP